MTKVQAKKLCTHLDKTFDEIYMLESIIKLIKESCLEKEIDSKYYNLDSFDKILLSEERNHYINLLSMAIDKLSDLKQMNVNLEKEVFF